jgi:hypothetical protein
MQLLLYSGDSACAPGSRPFWCNVTVTRRLPAQRPLSMQPLGTGNNRSTLTARMVRCKIESNPVFRVERLRAVALDDFELQVDDTATQVVCPIHNAAEQHLR